MSDTTGLQPKRARPAEGIPTSPPSGSGKNHQRHQRHHRNNQRKQGPKPEPSPTHPRQHACRDRKQRVSQDEDDYENDRDHDGSLISTLSTDRLVIPKRSCERDVTAPLRSLS